LKIALITDTHFGARSNNDTFSEYFYKFYEEQFFPYLEKHNIKEIIHCGDLMDNRKNVNINTLYEMRNRFLQPLEDMECVMHTVVGNHDTYFKSKVSINSVEELFDTHIETPIIAYSEPSTFVFGDLPIDIIPWINDENEEKVLEFIKNSKSTIAVGHFDLMGFEMYRGVTSRYHSRAIDFLKKYDMVFSGHYHHKSDNGQVFYLGSPYEINWADYDDPRGFHIFDTETLELTFIQNSDRLHHKIFYDDSEDVTILDNINEYEDKIVKLVVIEKSDYQQYDNVIDELDNVSKELMIIEDFTLDDDEDDIITTEDTLTALNNFVDSTELEKKDSDVVKKILQELYVEAINVA